MLVAISNALAGKGRTAGGEEGPSARVAGQLDAILLEQGGQEAQALRGWDYIEGRPLNVHTPPRLLRTRLQTWGTGASARIRLGFSGPSRPGLAECMRGVPRERATDPFVDFHGDYPKTDPREAIPGEEVAALLASGLEGRGFPAHRVIAVDFERIIECSSGGLRYSVRVWIDWEEMDRWEVCCPPAVGFLGRLFGRPDRSAHKRPPEAIDEVLRQGAGARDVRWFAGYETAGYRGTLPWCPGPVVFR